ncbi:hypothetical protein SNUCP2_23440 [Clostridium perfringens A]|nr:hypothetical protein JUM001_19510 [Clostridium perfringens]
MLILIPSLNNKANLIIYKKIIYFNYILKIAKLKDYNHKTYSYNPIIKFLFILALKN